MIFGVSEYTLAFRRALASHPEGPYATQGWMVARPVLTPFAALPSCPGDGEIEQLLTVRICSTLAMDDAAYERFLVSSGVLRQTLRLVARVRLRDPRSVEMTRRKVQSLIMQAEVRHIADSLSA